MTQFYQEIQHPDSLFLLGEGQDAQREKTLGIRPAIRTITEYHVTALSVTSQHPDFMLWVEEPFLTENCQKLSQEQALNLLPRLSELL